MMRVKGLLHEAKRRPKGITKTTTEVEEKENLIKQDFTAEKPFTKLLTDITQIGCREGKLLNFPTSIIDKKQDLNLEKYI